MRGAVTDILGTEHVNLEVLFNLYLFRNILITKKIKEVGPGMLAYVFSPSTEDVKSLVDSSTAWSKQRDPG